MRRRSLRVLLTGSATALVVPLAACGASSALPQESAPPRGSAPAQASALAHESTLFQKKAAQPPEKSARTPDRAGSAAAPVETTPKPTGDRRGGNDAKAPAHDPAKLESIEVKPGDDTYDRIVFGFSGTRGGKQLPEHVPSWLEDYPRRPGSGKPVEMEGQLFLHINFSPATAGDVREAVDADLPSVTDVRYLGGFEKVQEAAIGVNSCQGDPVRPWFRVTTRNNAVVVDVGTPNCGSDDPVTRECGDVGFEPSTDSGAFGITATNVGCEKAREVAALAEGQVGDPYGTPGGFSCLPEYDDSEPTPNYVYTCTREDAKVTFTTG